MARKNDLKDLGEVYGNLGKEATVVAENVEAATVGDKNANVGDAELTAGGGTEAGGFVETETDIEKVGDKNPYNVKGLSYGQDNCPTLETDKVEAVEEDEETLEETLESEQDGINNGMAKKSVFDELYSKVISEDFGMEEQDDLNALGIDEAPTDAELGEEGDDDAEGGDEVTFTLDKETAQKLHDVLMAVLGGEEGGDDEDGDEDVADEVEVEDGEHYEEDNEGAPKAHTTHVDMGTQNKVGSLGAGNDAFGSTPKVQAANKVDHPTAGPSDTDGAPQSHSGAFNDGKNNKVGSLNAGSDAFGSTPKVQPKNKDVKAG